jgi:hypothetical protein
MSCRAGSPYPAALKTPFMKGHGMKKARLRFLAASLFIIFSVIGTEVFFCPYRWSGTPKALFLIKYHGKWGFIDETGRIVISPKYEVRGGNDIELWDAVVKKNIQGIPLPGYRIFPRKSENGLTVKTIGKHCGFVDSTGKLVIPAIYDYAKEFSEGFAVVWEGSYWGHIDKTGNLLNNAQFGGADSFSEGFACVHTKEGVGYIDKTGQFVIKPQFDCPQSSYDGLRSFYSGLAAVVNANEKWGFIDKTGKLVIGYQFDEVRPFSEGLAAVCIGSKWGYIDRTGAMVIATQFEYASCFEYGLAGVMTRDRVPNSMTGPIGEMGYIDRSGRFVWGPYDTEPFLTRLDLFCKPVVDLFDRVDAWSQRLTE